MLPDTEEEELEFLRGAGFDEYPQDETSTISLKKLLDETRDFIDRYTNLIFLILH